MLVSESRPEQNNLFNFLTGSTMEAPSSTQNSVCAYIELDYEGDRLVFNKVKDSFEDQRYGVDIADLTGINNPETSKTTKCELIYAFLTTQLYDLEFLVDYFPAKIPIDLVCPTKSRIVVPDGHPVKDMQVSVKHYPRKMHGSMHAALWLLQYKTHLRVVISSANLKYMDWDGMTENFWYQDFPKKEKESISSSQDLIELQNEEIIPPWTPAKVAMKFQRDLKEFVVALDVLDNVSFLDEYDYSKAKVFLVSSVPGEYAVNDEHPFTRCGQLRMRYLLQSFDWPQEHRDVLIQTSNVGSLAERWFVDICRSFDIDREPETHRLGLKIVFPSMKTVKDSQHGGPHGWYFYWLDESHYVDDYLYDSKDERYPGLLLHSKIFLKEYSNGSGWCYAGTANISQSAWGVFQLNKRQFNLKNFELGVLFVKHAQLNNLGDNNTDDNNTNVNNTNNNSENNTDKNDADPRENEKFLGSLYLPFPKTLVKYNNDDLPWVQKSSY